MPRLREASAARQQLARLLNSFKECVQTLLSIHHTLHRGSFVLLNKKCGKANCTCARGQPHLTRYLSWSQDGRTRMVHVGQDDAATVRAAAERYQRFRRARAELVKLSKEIIEGVDQLAEALIDSYPQRRTQEGDDGGSGGGGGTRGRSTAERKR